MRTLGLLALTTIAATANAQPVFTVSLGASGTNATITGRLVVLLKPVGSTVREDPIDGPFWEQPQPIFGMNIIEATQGSDVVMPDSADGYPAPLRDLPPGTYQVQARLDRSHIDSNWRREPGNLFTGKVVEFTFKAGERPSVMLTLDRETDLKPLPTVEGCEWFEVESKLLSSFRAKPVKLRAGVVLPIDYDPKNSYAAVYEVPGFGGDHTSASGRARRLRGTGADSTESTLARQAFWIVLDPEGPNGHTLFVDSDNNGPCGRALVEELIPALEAKYSLTASPQRRLLRGHSSGGWSTLWLATQYPGTFGATWSSSPDPVDFRRFQLSDIYSDPNIYGPATGEAERSALPAATIDDHGAPHWVSYRRGGKPLMTAERELTQEDVLGPDNTSGQQWDSWFAAWGPRNVAGNPAALFDPRSGKIDRVISGQFAAFDIARLLRDKPEVYGPIFRDRVRLIVGDADNFFLEQAVLLLRADLASRNIAGGKGYINVIPGKDHGSVFATREIRAITREMIDHLAANP